MLEVLTDFVAELRRAGLPVSLTEAVDAAQALGEIDVANRPALRSALGATLVKSSSHWPAFDITFEVFFALRGSQYAIASSDPNAIDPSAMAPAEGAAGVGGGGGEGLGPDELTEMLLGALLDGREAALAAIARLAVTRFAGMAPGRPVGGTYYLHRTLRQLDLEALVGPLLESARAASARGEEIGRLPARHGDLDDRLLEDELRARLEALRRAIEAEIRRRLVADRGAEALAKSVRSPLPEDIEFMHATRKELVLIRRSLPGLARKLASRLQRRRRHRRQGPLDFRATVRRSLAYGGVPLEARFRPPRQSKPEIFVIADVSGSVAAFARFTLQLVYAIASEFSLVRSFVFVDGIDEVTRIFERSATIVEAVQRVNSEADVVWVDGHSDYGHAFSVFNQRWGRQIGARTNVLVLGDARNNYHRSESWVLREIRRRARRLYWLDPEPESYWGSGDSIVGEYARYCDGVFECRNLRQLEAFIERLA